MAIAALVAVSCGGGDESAGEPSTTATSVTSTTTLAPATTLAPTSAPTTTEPWTRPAWASEAISEAGLARLVELFEDELGRRGHKVSAGDGVAVLADGTALGLTNLSGVVAAAPDDEWPALVAEHVDRVLTAELEPSAEYDEVRGQLRVRMWGTETLEAAAGMGAVSVEVAEGLHKVLVIDFPTEVLAVTAADLAEWAVDTSDAFDEAQANTEAAEWDLLVHSADVALANSSVDIYEGSFYTSSFVVSPLLLDALDAPLGAWVSAPVGHVVLVHEIVDQSALSALSEMAIAAAGFWADGPSSLSPDVYRWFEGELTRVPLIEIPGQGFAIPVDLLDLTAGLPPA